MAEVKTFYRSKYNGKQFDEILENVYDAVPIDGSKPMTAPLTIKEVENGYTQLEKNHTQTTDLGTALRDVSKGGSVVALLLKAADQAARLQFGASVYDLIHTGNIQPYVKPYADTAQAASEAAESALEGVREAIEAIPEGAATPIVNDLTTGGASMALSAEMGKVLGDESFIFRKSIPANSDLNTVFEPGGYYIISANATSVANIPVASASQLYVFAADNSAGRILQLFTRTNPVAFNGSVLWYRVINTLDGIFGDWKTIATTDAALMKTDKPRGNYTGNGSVTSRTIDIGGLGNVVAIWSGEYGYAIVFGVGAIAANANGAKYFSGVAIKYVNGKITVASADNFLNANGITYYYQVL